jgi:endonuclease I
MSIVPRVLWIFVLAASITLTYSAEAQQTKHRTYDGSRDNYWREIYPDRSAEEKPYSELYCERQFRKKTAPLTLEHAYPANWMVAAKQCGTRDRCRSEHDDFGYIEADFHNLFPAVEPANRARSNNLFGILGEDAPRPVRNCPLKVDTQANIAEPRAVVRGNLARAIFYIAHTYELPIDRGMFPILIEWHRRDPVTRDERAIHDRVTLSQETTNRFVTGQLDPARVRFRLCAAEFEGNSVRWRNCERGQ